MRHLLKAFGDLVAFDFIDARRIMDQGIHIDREMFVIRERYTGIIWTYPSMEKFTADVINAVNHFKGLRKINNTIEGMKIRELRKGEPEVDGPAGERLMIVMMMMMMSMNLQNQGCLTTRTLPKGRLMTILTTRPLTSAKMRMMGEMILNLMMIQRRLLPLHQNPKSLLLSSEMIMYLLEIQQWTTREKALRAMESSISTTSERR